MREPLGKTKETTLRDVAAVVFRRMGVILTVFLGAVVTVFLINLSAKPVYQSDAKLLVNRGQLESVYSSHLVVLPWDEDLNSQIEVIESQAMAERAQKIATSEKKLDTAGQPIQLSADNVKATTSGKASVLIVTYTSNDPEESRNALESLTRAYVEWRQQVGPSPGVDSFFQEELESLRDQLSQWEQRRADFMTEQGVQNITGERESLLRQKENLANQLLLQKERLADFAARLEAVQNLQQEKRSDPNIEIFGIGDAEYDDEGLLSNLRKEVLARRSDYYDKRSRLTDQHPEVKAAKDLLDRLQAQLDVATENYVRLLESRVAVTKARIESLTATNTGIDDALAVLPDKEARLAQYDRIIAGLQADYATMADKQIAAKAEVSGRTEWHVVILQPASKAVRQRMRDYVRLALVPAFSLLIGLALAFGIDGLDHSLKDATEAEAELGVPVLGSLSRIR